MTDLEMALAAFSVLLVVDRILTARANAQERGRLLDRIQARSLPEYKALTDRPKPQKAKSSPSPPDVGDAVTDEVVLPDMTPGRYPQAMNAARELME